MKKKLAQGLSGGADRIGKCGRKRKTTPRIDRKIVNMAKNDPRASCKKLATIMQAEGIEVHRKTINRRLLEVGMKAY